MNVDQMLQALTSPPLTPVILPEPANRPEVTATCTPDVVDWLDPTGALRAAGLLVVTKAEGTS